MSNSSLNYVIGTGLSFLGITGVILSNKIESQAGLFVSTAVLVSSFAFFHKGSKIYDPNSALLNSISENYTHPIEAMHKIPISENPMHPAELVERLHNEDSSSVCEATFRD